MNYQDFISKQKSLLIAPAGYGKTHTIATCLEHTTGKQLILTHTHAGVASIKEKIKKSFIKSADYSVETITSFAQKYVHGFCKQSDIPEQGNATEYYPFIIKKATELIKLKPIARVISATYEGVFVDEYQDCTLQQHDLILALADILPCRMLGDPLQGIFNFNGDNLVNLNDDSHMGAFSLNKYHLVDPWRWKNINEPLGKNLQEIRKELEASKTIDLNKYTAIEVYRIVENDLYDARKIYNQTIRNLFDNSSVLIIHPDTSNIHGRKKVIATFNNVFLLVEAIDDKDFYKIAKAFDSATAENISKVIRDVCHQLFKKTSCDNWFNEVGFKNKRGNDALLIAPIITAVFSLKETLSFASISIILRDLSKLPDMKCYRKELFSSVLKALKEASINSITVNESMIAKRNQTRRIGRKVYGKCIGTTLLTKGLEFETVVILNAHKFTCPKNLYVALTRASKRLIVFTENTTLSPTY